jgi:type I restriction enzyme S subunit
MSADVREPSAKYLAQAKYRQTEVGLIPSDWETCRMDRCASSVGSGRSKPNNPFGSYPVYGSTGVIGCTDSPEYEGDAILVARVGANAGTLNLVCGKYGVTDNTIILRLREGIELPFVLRQLEAKRLNSMAFGSGQPLITGSQLKALQLVMPRVEEQHAIATALSNVDALIAAQERLIAKKRDIKQAAMQQLLTGQTRLQGFSGEWHQGVFGDVVSSLEAGVSVNSTDAETAIDAPCVLKTSALVAGRFLPNEAKVIEARDVGRARTSVKGDTILISRMNTPALVGEVAYAAQDFDSLYLPDRVWMARFNPSKKLNVRWMAFVLSSQPYRDLLREVATGTSGSMKNISKDALRTLPIRFPSTEEQTAIATVLSDMDADLTTLESRLAKTRAIKQGMMQELLTGRTRLV